MPDDDLTSADPTPRRFSRAGSASSETRQAVLGLNDLERKFSFAGAAVTLLFIAFYIPERLLKNTSITVTSAKLKDGSCASGYHLVTSLCSKTTIYHPSYWVIPFIYIVAMGAAIGIFALLRKRAGVIVASFMLGLASGIVGSAGFVFLALGAWLAVRAFRISRYGDPTFRGANIKARERALERRANRASPAARAKSKKSAAASATASRTPAPSKRYTPKKTNRR